MLFKVGAAKKVMHQRQIRPRSCSRVKLLNSFFRIAFRQPRFTDIQMEFRRVLSDGKHPVGCLFFQRHVG